MNVHAQTLAALLEAERTTRAADMAHPSHEAVIAAFRALAARVSFQMAMPRRDHKHG